MGRKEIKENEKNLRRDEIARTAVELFDQKGYLKTTMDDIAALAEYTKMTLYSYFEDKEDILLYACLSSIKNVNGFITSITRQKTTGFEILKEIAVTYRDYFLHQRPYYKIMNISRFANPETYKKALYQEILGQKAMMSQLITHALQKGIADQTINLSIEPSKFAPMIMSFTNGFYNFLDENENQLPNFFGMSADEMLEYGMEYIINSVKK